MNEVSQMQKPNSGRTTDVRRSVSRANFVDVEPDVIAITCPIFGTARRLTLI
jgi:hypothetical protein